MKVLDEKASERGRQRRRQHGRLVHCCCICGRLDTWGATWSAYYSIKDLDDGVPIPKFCSTECRKKGGKNATGVTTDMLKQARHAEERDPVLVFREMTDREKYQAALRGQRDART